MTTLLSRLCTEQGFRCWWCGKPMVLKVPGARQEREHATVEHVVPKAYRLGIKEREQAIVAAHYGCNQRRGSRFSWPQFVRYQNHRKRCDDNALVDAKHGHHRRGG